MDKREEINDVVDESETVMDDAELEDIEENIDDKVKKLRAKLKQCETDKMSSLEELQRAKADFLNARKRLEEERVKDRERSLLAHVEELLPLCDSFEMALADASFQEAPVNLQKGINGINSQLSSILKNYQVTPIGEVGVEFDPREYEAVENVPVEKKEEDHKVIKVIQRGYKLNDTVIRPARVAVGAFQA